MTKLKLLQPYYWPTLHCVYIMLFTKEDAGYCVTLLSPAAHAGNRYVYPTLNLQSGWRELTLHQLHSFRLQGKLSSKEYHTILELYENI